MNISLTYGSGRLSLDLPATFTVDTYAPRRIDTEVTLDQFRTDFLAHGGEALLGTTPLIIVNDGYRNTPTAHLLGWLDQLEPALLDRADFLIATGTHAAPTDTHYRRILGPHHDRLRTRVRYHDCHDTSSMIRFTADPLGGDVYVNKSVFEDRPVLILGSVEPHYFAGYTGGRKAIFPGLIDLATTERNHNLAASMDAAPLRLAGNPVAEHLAQLTRLIDHPRFFSIQAVLDAHHRLAGIFCGRLANSFARAVDLVDSIYAHRISCPYDLVLAELRPPLDRNLYQLQKAVENCQRAVADNGTLIIISACEEGIGSPHFYGLAERWDPVGNAPRDGSPATFGSHKLSRVIAIARRIRLRVHSTLKVEDVRRVFYEPLDNVQEFLYLTRNACENSNVAVVHDAGHTVLVN